MKTIKRYSNRKLYDTDQSSYVTLDEIAEMVRAGQDVQIIDNKSGNDLTRVTLAQILFEEEKRDRKVLPLSALKMIIQSPAELITKIKQPITEFREQTHQQVERLRNRAQAQQEEVVAPVREAIESFQRSIDEMQRGVDEKLKTALNAVHPLQRVGIEVDELRQRVVLLEAEIAALRGEAAPPKAANE